MNDRHVRLALRLCETAGMPDFLDNLHHELLAAGILDAVATSNTTALYGWLMAAFSFQGISDAVARGYMATHGNAAYTDVDHMIGKQTTSCIKLTNFDAYQDCNFRKIARTCANPSELPRCPVGRLRLRNGRLNQTAFALYLFMRDVCHGDLVGFIDRRLAEADRPDHPDRLATMRDALVGDLRRIHGVSNKILNMAFADLLLAGDPGRSTWRAVGASMIAIDTLVHNLLHRTGLIQRYGTVHSYGAACYRDDGCAGVVDRLARLIDARRFNPTFPSYFPRFVQHALWRHCAAGEFDVCNGRRIAGGAKCKNDGCAVHRLCDRLPLKSSPLLPTEANGAP